MEIQEKENGQPIQPEARGVTVRSSWNFSMDHIREDIRDYKPETKEVLVAAFRWCIDDHHPVSRPDFAKRVKCSDNLLYKIYTGQYKHPQTGATMQPAEELIESIKEFLNLERERFLGGAMDFVETPTARKVINACELARESQKIVIVYGPSQIGKTWTFEHYTASNNHGRTTYCRLKAASGLGGMVRAIASAMGVSDKSNTADLITRIKGAASPDMLLILDEVHLLANTYRKGSFFGCMEVIREIHDETKMGIVLGFTLLDEIKAASQKELQQIWRRGVHKVPLPLMPTKADLAAILKHHGLDFPGRDVSLTVTSSSGKPHTEQPYEILRLTAKKEGLLAITERIRYAKKLASKSGKKLTWHHFVHADCIIAEQAEQEGEWA